MMGEAHGFSPQMKKAYLQAIPCSPCQLDVPAPMIRMDERGAAKSVGGSTQGILLGLWSEVRETSHGYNASGCMLSIAALDS